MANSSERTSLEGSLSFGRDDPPLQTDVSMLPRRKRRKGCLTCLNRKVKCDDQAGVCRRCAKLQLHCVWPDETQDGATSSTNEQRRHDSETTQAGYKRLRAVAACTNCRKRKHKCDSHRPSCESCLRSGKTCVYDIADDAQSSPQPLTPSSDLKVTSPDHYDHSTVQSATSPLILSHTTPSDGHGGGSALQSSNISMTQMAPGQSLLPFVDSYFKNIHPVCCNNFLHAGTMCDAIEQGRAPQVLLLAMCGIAAKFLSDSASHNCGRIWLAEARKLAFERLDSISILNVVVLQTLALHDIHEGKLASAWNLIGLAFNMSSSLKLNKPPFSDSEASSMDSDIFIERECQQRLLWSLFVSDCLFEFGHSHIDEQFVIDLPMPCNAWFFIHSSFCRTLRLYEETTDGLIRTATNPSMYLIKIIVLRRKILKNARDSVGLENPPPWNETSTFHTLAEELESFRQSLMQNFPFMGRQIYSFRSGRQLDMLLMIHVWYHQSFCDLYGQWMPGHPRETSNMTSRDVPQEFVQKCTEITFLHASQIPSLLQRVLSVEPDHIFRDVWLGFCVLDSVRALIAGSKLVFVHSHITDELISLLKINMVALEKVRHIFLLAEKIYQECVRNIQNAGLGDNVGVGASTNTSPKSWESGRTNLNEKLEMYNHLEFLAAKELPDDSRWRRLFDRKNSPPRQHLVSESATSTLQNRTGQISSPNNQSAPAPYSFTEMQWLDRLAMENLDSWQRETFYEPQNASSSGVGNGDANMETNAPFAGYDTWMDQFFANSLASAPPDSMAAAFVLNDIRHQQT